MARVLVHMHNEGLPVTRGLGQFQKECVLPGWGGGPVYALHGAEFHLSIVSDVLMFLCGQDNIHSGLVKFMVCGLAGVAQELC